jgi:hypothetical protein
MVHSIPSRLYDPGSAPEEIDENNRVISHKVLWHLDEVKAFIDAQGQILLVTRSAREDLLALNWTLPQLRGLIKLLKPGHHENAQWCATSAVTRRVVIPCDAYVMGYNRITGRETPERTPHFYVKFGFRSGVMAMMLVSCHEDRRPSGE